MRNKSRSFGCERKVRAECKLLKEEANEKEETEEEVAETADDEGIENNENEEVWSTVKIKPRLAFKGKNIENPLDKNQENELKSGNEHDGGTSFEPLSVESFGNNLD